MNQDKVIKMGYSAIICRVSHFGKLKRYCTLVQRIGHGAAMHTMRLIAQSIGEPNIVGKQI